MQSESDEGSSEEEEGEEIVEEEPTDDLKHAYLSLLPHETLVGLVLSLDRDRDAQIWPADLNVAISALREHNKRLAGHPMNQPLPPSIPSPSKTRPPAPLQYPPQPSAARPQPPYAQPHGPPHQQLHPHPQALNQPQQQQHPRPPMPGHPIPQPHSYPPQYPMQPPGKPPQATGRPPTLPNSSNTLSYEEMIVIAITDINDPTGSAPKTVFEYMGSHWPIAANFRPSASQALTKAYKRGRLEKVGAKYRMNPLWEGGNTSRRTTRRPQTINTGPPPPPSLHMLPNHPQGPPGPYHWPGPGGYPLQYQPMPQQQFGQPPAPFPYGAPPVGVRMEEPEDEDEEEDEEDGDEGDEEGDEGEVDIPPSGPPSLKESLRTLAQLLAESVRSQPAVHGSHQGFSVKVEG